MKSTTALMRENQASAASNTANMPTAIVVNHVANDVAHAVARSWMNVATAEIALAQMGCGVVNWRAAPPSQNALAGMLCNIVASDTAIFCVGFQAYAYQIAAGETLCDVMRQYLGKSLPGNTVQMSAEDVAGNLSKGRLNIVALHIEDKAGWNDVRTISSAAIKANAPIVVLASSSVPAPEGVVIEVANDWSATLNAVRDAVDVVAGNGSIRVVAFHDETPSVLESAMMTATGMTPAAWGEQVRINNDGAEIAANAAYQSPVESF